MGESGQRRYWRRPLVVAFGSLFGGSWLVVGTGGAIAADDIGQFAGSLAFAAAGACILVGSFSHVTASTSGVSVIYAVKVRHWNWHEISEIAVEQVRDAENVIEQLVFAPWTPTIRR